MNNLWIYGCSFSEPFGMINYYVEYTGQYNQRLLDGMEFWGTHLSKILNMNCIVKSLAGVGWNYINDKIDEDIINWNLDDIIIISPSFFSRVTLEEFKNRECQQELSDKMKTWDEIYTYNENRWVNKIKTLQYFNFNIFTWIVEKSNRISEVENLIYTPNGYSNWKDWMDLHKEFWIDPTFNKYPCGDWHFNSNGHIAVSNIMYEFITKKMK